MTKFVYFSIIFCLTLWHQGQHQIAKISITMKTFIVLSVCVAVAMCAVIQPSAKAALRLQPAVEHQEEHDELGQYSLRYVTAEGVVVSAHGRLVPNSNGTGHVLITDGEYSYIGDDGKTYVTKYSAGLDGFQVEGDHIPKAPEPESAPSA